MSSTLRVAIVLLAISTLVVPPVSGGAPYLALRDCDVEVGTFPAPVALLAQFLPPGFSAATIDPAGAVGEAYGLALRCGSASWGNGASEGEVRFLSGGPFVVPPAELRSPGVDAYVISHASMATDAGVATVFGSWSFPQAFVSNVSWEATPVALAVTAQAGSLQVSLDSATLGGPAHVPETTWRVFAVDQVDDPTTVYGSVDLVVPAHDATVAGLADLRGQGGADVTPPPPALAGTGSFASVPEMTWTPSG